MLNLHHIMPEKMVGFWLEVVFEVFEGANVYLL
jgi:hypothetical protein